MEFIYLIEGIVLISSSSSLLLLLLLFLGGRVDWGSETKRKRMGEK